MKYGIKIKGKLDNDGFYVENRIRSILSEHTGHDNEKPLLFDSCSEAEIYAQNLELKNYSVEVVV